MHKAVLFSFLILVGFAMETLAEGNLTVTSVSGIKHTSKKLKESMNVILFWRSDCAPCLMEMQHLPEIAKSDPNATIALVAAEDKEAMLKNLPKNLPANIEVFFVGDHFRETLLDFGDEMTALPFSVALHKNGSICDRNYGMLDLKKFKYWRKTC